MGGAFHGSRVQFALALLGIRNWFLIILVIIINYFYFLISQCFILTWFVSHITFGVTRLLLLSRVSLLITSTRERETEKRQGIKLI